MLLVLQGARSSECLTWARRAGTCRTDDMLHGDEQWKAHGVVHATGK